MELKYYVPEISEFYVGFEYEEENDLEDNVWIKRTLDFSYDWLEIHKDFANGKRVKYLDTNDIEELGFTVVKTKEILSKQLRNLILLMIIILAKVNTI